MIIKNANSLTLDEKSKFRESYTRYFEETNTVSTSQEVENNPLKTFLSSKSERYAIEMIRKIKYGDRTAFIGFDEVDESLIGFIVGDIGQYIGEVSHLYCKGKSFIDRQKNKGELIKSFAREALAKGAEQVKITNQYGIIGAQELAMVLNGLGFQPQKTTATETEYIQSSKRL